MAHIIFEAYPHLMVYFDTIFLSTTNNEKGQWNKQQTYKNYFSPL